MSPVNIDEWRMYMNVQDRKAHVSFFFVAHGDCSLETHPVMCTLSIPGKGNALVHRFCGRSPMVSQYFVLLLLMFVAVNVKVSNFLFNIRILH